MKTTLKNALPIAFVLAALPFSGRAADQRKDVNIGKISACVFKTYPQFGSITISNHSPKFLLDRPFTIGVDASFLESAAAYNIAIDGAGNLPGGLSGPSRTETAEFNLTSSTVRFERYMQNANTNNGISVKASLDIDVPYSSLTDSDKKIMGVFMSCARQAGVTGIGVARPIQDIPALPSNAAKPG